MTKIIIFIFSFDPQIICGQNLTQNMLFTFVVSVKNAFLVLSQDCENVIILLKPFYGTHKKFGSMTISSNLGQLKPKCGCCVLRFYFG